MMTRTQTILAATAVGLIAWAAGQRAAAQFQAPLNSLSLDDTGAIEGIQGNIVKFRDSKNEPWLLTIVKDTTMSIEGEADAAYLRPGLIVELTGEIDKKNALAEPVKEMLVYGGKSKVMVGLFSADEEAEDAKPVRNPEAGKYRIRGRVASTKDGELLIAAGRVKITGKIGDDLKVKLKLDDASAAQFGDTMKVKAWYYDGGKPNLTNNRPGQALAEEVSITLSQPPTTGKRARPSSRSTKTVEDPVKSSK